MANNVKITNKSPFQCDIAGIKFGHGITSVEVRKPEFLTRYINDLTVPGLVAEVIAAPASAAAKTTIKKGE